MNIVKIENVRVLDPIAKTDSVQTVYVENGKLVAETANVAETINGEGKWLIRLRSSEWEPPIFAAWWDHPH